MDHHDFGPQGPRLLGQGPNVSRWDVGQLDAEQKNEGKVAPLVARKAQQPAQQLVQQGTALPVVHRASVVRIHQREVPQRRALVDVGHPLMERHDGNLEGQADDDQAQADPLYTQAAMELQQLQSGLLSTRRVTHKVRPGESLSVIARRYRVSVKDLQRWNNISDPRKLRAGKTITVYHSQAIPGKATSGTTRYVVRRGDSLWSIARKHNVKVNDLAAWNGLGDETLLRPGQSLKIIHLLQLIGTW